jgi:hypothetical protein
LNLADFRSKNQRFRENLPPEPTVGCRRRWHERPEPPANPPNLNRVMPAEEIGMEFRAGVRVAGAAAAGIAA